MMLGDMTVGRLNLKYRAYGETFTSELRAKECKDKHPDRRMYTLIDYAACDVFYNPNTRKAEVRKGAEKQVIGWLVTKIEARRKI